MTDEQQLLPFDEFEEEKKQVIKELPHFQEPKNDNERLLELQYEFRNGRPEAIIEFYKLSKDLCLRIINAIGRNNWHVRALDEMERDIKAHDAASYIPEQLVKKPLWAVTKNIPGYLFLRVQKELFYRRKVDKIVDFVDFDRFFKEGQEPEVLDWLKNIEDTEEDKQDMKSYIAIGANGKNLEFRSQGEVLAYFEIHSKELLKAVIKGTPVKDPDTGEAYYLDELPEEGDKE